MISSWSTCHKILHILMFITSFGEQNITYKCCSNFLIHLSILGGFVGLIILAVTLPRLDRSVRNLSVNKFVLALLYWVSCTAIFVLFGSSKFFFNNPLVLLIFVLLFFGSVYLSVIRLADMRKKDWLILSGILGAIVLFFFLPKF